MARRSSRNILGRTRRGVTPVIAIVLLLMMTVAAAGGAYTWFSQMQQDIMSQTEQDIQTSFSVKGLQCNIVSSGPDEIVIQMKNDGKASVDASKVDVFVYDSSNDLNITVTGLDWSDKAFTSPGGFAEATVDLSQSSSTTFLESGAFYNVEVDFTNTGTTVNAGSCIGES